MNERPKVLFVGQTALANPGAAEDALRTELEERCELRSVKSPLQALSTLKQERFDAIYLAADFVPQASQLGTLLQSTKILDAMPDGVALLDELLRVVWANRTLAEWCRQADLSGRSFYELLKVAEISGPEACPLNAALTSRRASSSTLRLEDGRFLRLHAAPIDPEDEAPKQLIVTVRDVTGDVLEQQKLAAIHQAGLDLANLKPEEVSLMSISERIELLKDDILRYTKDLLHFDVVEIRLLSEDTGRLDPLLAHGMDEAATHRVLYALPSDNGVTGFVASTGKSYLCENTSADKLYVQGVQGAKSSLTVPLVLHEKVIGTFNVESPNLKAFTESDCQFLEIFSRDVANALNTLELLQVEQNSAALRSIEAVHATVALPVDVILNDAVNLMELYLGHKPEVVERLQRILQGARDIKQLIQKVGQRMTPCNAKPVGQQSPGRPLLAGKRILVADEDPCVREAAHRLLERYQCEVETAHDGEEALRMVRACRLGACGEYDVIIADIRLPDMTGHQFMVRLQETIERPPLALMTGYGYDPGHSLSKARQNGLDTWAVLYKPFRLDQLLEAVERMILKYQGPDAASAAVLAT